ncbi:MAG: tRNA (guanosine(37)-N1)-methyltransferase TrmD [Catenulispora sp.]
MRIDIVTIFPEYLAPLDVSLIGKAAAAGILDIHVHELRAWTHDRHNTVDGSPCGGGPGMVMKPEPWWEALSQLVPPGAESGARLIVPTPSGRPFTQRVAEDLATASHLVFAPARYEGIDRRFIEAAAERMPVAELSIGDYVLAGGEVAVLVMVEAVGRLLPGVLGNAESAKDDSFGHASEGGMAGLLEGPVYTKPAVWAGREVPPVLLGGNHAVINRWRRDEALRRTARMRPDLIEALDPEALDKKDRALLAALGWSPGPTGFRFDPDAVADWAGTA